MKLVALACLLGSSQAYKLVSRELAYDDAENNPWASAMAGIDVKDYNKSAPKGYTEAEKPKVDMELIARKKIEREMKAKEEEKNKEERAKDYEDMLIELMSFSKNITPESLDKALKLKEKLEASGHPPAHFRVSTYSLWQKAFKHEAVKNYKFSKESMEDLLVAEKNLNRNIDSKSQQQIFLQTANEVKANFKKRYGADEFDP